MWARNLGLQMISNVSVEIGGGNGYWCTRCRKLYRTKPEVGFKCQNIHTYTERNNEKLERVLHILGDIDDESARQYIYEDKSSPQIEAIFKDVTSSQTMEEYYNEIVYEDLMDYIDRRYSNEIYDHVETICNNDIFALEDRRGVVVDNQSADWRNLWYQLTPK